DIVVNSTNDSALNLFGSGNLTATNIQVAGGLSQSGSFNISPSPQLKAPQLPDPLKGLAPPVGIRDNQGVFHSGLCDQNNFVVDGGVATLNPGTYCNGITITGKSRVTFNPGTYVLMGGGLVVNNTSSIPATLTGTGVTFFLTQAPGYTYGPLTVTGLVAAALKAPISGPMKGILFFQDPSIGAGPARGFRGSVTTTFERVLYFPTTGLV